MEYGIMKNQEEDKVTIGNIIGSLLMFLLCFGIIGGCVVGLVHMFNKSDRCYSEYAISTGSVYRHSSLDYNRDDITGVCYGRYDRGISVVDCSPKVLKMVDARRKLTKCLSGN